MSGKWVKAPESNRVIHGLSHDQTQNLVTYLNFKGPNFNVPVKNWGIELELGDTLSLYIISKK